MTAFTTGVEAEEMARRGGILLHPTSLPGPGIGEIGEAAYRFVDWLGEAGQTYWQILPLGPVDRGGSPYNSLSALAGNPLLVAEADLLALGLVSDTSVLDTSEESGPIDYGSLIRRKGRLLDQAYREFKSRGRTELGEEFDEFRRVNQDWLSDFSLFAAARAHHREAAWTDWPIELRDRRPEGIQRWRSELSEEIENQEFQQFLFSRSWRKLHDYARDRGIRIVGDVPIFVAFDSADVWANRDIFQLDDEGQPIVVAGVPPDYFSATGQRWGNPLYRWDVLRERGYDWWVERFRRAFEMVDVLRIDHFRGFESYWAIEANEETAVNGEWVKGPGQDFFRKIEQQLGEAPFIAEDLGMITRDVEILRDELGMPGMRVLQFAFDGDPRNPHLPENCPFNSVAYTGTHDNDTILGWWAGLNEEERDRVHHWLAGQEATHWTFIRRVFDSAAALAVVPLQDVLGLDSEARMNTPGQATANWTWQLDQLPGAESARRMRDVTGESGRLPPDARSGV